MPAKVNEPFDSNIFFIQPAASHPPPWHHQDPMPQHRRRVQDPNAHDDDEKINRYNIERVLDDSLLHGASLDGEQALQSSALHQGVFI